MDICLQGMLDGVDAAASISSQSGTPVVFMTGFADEETIERAKSAGAFGFLIKPVQRLDLEAAIRLAIDRHQRERQLAEDQGWLEARAAKDQLRHRERALEVVGLATQLFLRSPSWEQVISDVLQRVGEMTGASEVWIARPAAEPEREGWRWCAPGIDRHPARDSVPPSLRRCGAGGAHRPARPDLGGGVSGIREGQLLGWLGLVDRTLERQWLPTDLDAARAVAAALGAAIHRQGQEQRLRLLEKAVDTLPIGMTIAPTPLVASSTPTQAEAEMHRILGVPAGGSRGTAPRTAKSRWQDHPVQSSRTMVPTAGRRSTSGATAATPVQLASMSVRDDPGEVLGVITRLCGHLRAQGHRGSARAVEPDYHGLIENTRDAISSSPLMTARSSR